MNNLTQQRAHCGTPMALSQNSITNAFSCDVGYTTSIQLIICDSSPSAGRHPAVAGKRWFCNNSLYFRRRRRCFFFPELPFVTAANIFIPGTISISKTFSPPSWWSPGPKSLAGHSSRDPCRNSSRVGLRHIAREPLAWCRDLIEPVFYLFRTNTSSSNLFRISRRMAS